MNLSKRVPIEGCVDDVRDGIVYAQLIDGNNDAYCAEIDLDRFDDSDQPHCVPGALFLIKEPGPEIRLLLRTETQKCQCGRGECRS